MDADLFFPNATVSYFRKLHEAAESNQHENILRQICEKDCNAIEVRYHQQCSIDYTRTSYKSTACTR